MTEKIDANDVAAQLGPEGGRQLVDQLSAEAIWRSMREAGVYTLADLRAEVGSEHRRPVIENLLRQGETLNVVSSTKVGKTWITYSLAWSAISGRAWLHPTWFCHPGPVVIIDNELHKETITARTKAVREHMGLSESLEGQLIVVPLRGKWQTLDKLDGIIKHFQELQPVLIILDCLARFLPEGTSENDNAAMAQVYNQIDKLASLLDHSGVVVVHHSAKGNQAGKSITDVGRGAGAIVGSCDSHMVMREHEEADCFTLEAVARTWPRPSPIVLRWRFPVWEPTEHAPERLKGARPANAKNRPPDDLNDAAFASYLTDSWISPRNLIPSIAKRENWGEKNTRQLVDSIISAHHLEELLKEDGVKDCGTFLAQVNPANRGLLFKAKVVK